MKRRIWVTLLVMMSVLMLGACGTQEEENNASGSDATTENQTNASADTDGQVTNDETMDVQNADNTTTDVEVSMEALESLPVTPASEFEYSSYGDGVYVEAL